MALDPRTPVLVGVGQHQRRPPADPEALRTLGSPVDMMATAVRLAGDDSGTGDALLRRADLVQVVDIMSWQVPDPGRLVADEVGATGARTGRTTVGGNSPQLLVNQAALALQAGDVDVVVVTGCEAMYTRRLARRAGTDLGWPVPGDDDGPPPIGDPRPGSHDAELARGIAIPTQVYPILECAVRAAAGEGVDEHTARIADLWSRFSRVAAGNPNAWSPHEHTAAEIATPGPDNRMVGFPYTKLMNANLQVDQAAALVLCTVEAAASAGVPRDRWVFPWAGADAHDHWFVSERFQLHRSPAIAACGRRSLDLAGIGIDDVAHLDLYSCFPVAVELGAAALGIDAWDPSRVPTVTGGLGFAGGPGNNYVTHSIAAMAQRLRQDPGAVGLVTALGWFATKHSVGLYATEPPAGGFRWESAQPEVDAGPRRDVAADHDGPATLEGYTVMHERDGNPGTGLAACLLDDGRRAWATTTDPGTMKAMVTDDLAGRPVTLTPTGTFELT